MSMRPIHQYATIRRGQEELRRQAEYERMNRATRFKKWMSAKVQKRLHTPLKEQGYAAEKHSMI